MPTTVNIEKAQLVKYLTIAANQRKRAATKFNQDYGPSSATVQEITQEIATLDIAISQLNSQKDTPLEKAIAETDKKK